MLKLDNKLRKIYPQINVDHFYTWHNTFLKTFFFLFLRRRIKFENVTIKVKICGMTFPLFCKHITTQVPAIDYLVSIFMPLLIKNRQTSSWTLPFGANTLRVEYVRGVLLSHEVSSLSEFPMSCRLLVSGTDEFFWKIHILKNYHPKGVFDPPPRPPTKAKTLYSLNTSISK